MMDILAPPLSGEITSTVITEDDARLAFAKALHLVCPSIKDPVDVARTMLRILNRKGFELEKVK